MICDPWTSWRTDTSLRSLSAARTDVLALGLDDEHQEAATARAAQLAAERAAVPSQGVPAIDLRARHAGREAAFQVPAPVQETPKVGRRPVLLLQQGAQLVGLVTQRLEVGHPRIDVLDLFAEDGPGIALVTGPEQHDVVEDRGQHLVRHSLRLDHHGSARAEREQVEPAERGRVLVLLADRLAEHVDLDVACLLGQLARGHAFATEGVERVEQADREAARTAEAGRGRQVADGADVDRRLDLHEPERLPGDVVLQLVDVVDLLRPGVVQPDRLVEDLAVALDGHPDVLVDGGAQDGAVVALVEGRQVGAAAGQADAQRRPADHHRGARPASLSHCAAPSRRGCPACPGGIRSISSGRCGSVAQLARTTMLSP